MQMARWWVGTVVFAIGRDKVCVLRWRWRKRGAVSSSTSMSMNVGVGMGGMRVSMSMTLRGGSVAVDNIFRGSLCSGLLPALLLFAINGWANGRSIIVVVSGGSGSSRVRLGGQVMVVCRRQRRGGRLGGRVGALGDGDELGAILVCVLGGVSGRCRRGSSRFVGVGRHRRVVYQSRSGVELIKSEVYRGGGTGRRRSSERQKVTRGFFVEGNKARGRGAHVKTRAPGSLVEFVYGRRQADGWVGGWWFGG